MTAFDIRLDRDDYQADLSGWHCPLLTADVLTLKEVLGPDGKELEQGYWKSMPDHGGGLLKWIGPKEKRPERVRAHFEVTAPGAEPAKKSSLMTVLLPVLVAAAGAGGIGTTWIQRSDAISSANRKAEAATAELATTKQEARDAKKALDECKSRGSGTGGINMGTANNDSTSTVIGSSINCPPCPGGGAARPNGH